MGNYFDNQKSWSWNVTEDKVELTTDHGDHTHTLDLTGTSIGDMAENTGVVMGDAHRAAEHDFKTDNEQVNTETATETLGETSEHTGGAEIDGGMECGIE